jgi:FG-GAP repeat
MYRPPEGYYDVPFTWIFDASQLTDGVNALNQFVYIKAGYGDFICRRIVGLASVLNPTTGKFQIKDRYERPIESDPKFVTAPGTDDELLIREIDYPETSNIRFDLYNVLRDPPSYNFPPFTLAAQSPGLSTGEGISMSQIGGAGGTLGGDPILTFMLIGNPNAFSSSPSVGGSVRAAFSVTGEPMIAGTEYFPDPTFLNDNAGSAVSMSGTLAVYGAPSSPPSGGDANLGAAFVISRDDLGNWSQLQVLEGSDSVAGDTFGSGVGIDQAPNGTTIAVGAVAATSSKGAVYVFHESGGTWTQTQKLQPTDLSDGDLFGAPIVIYGNWMFIAAQQQSSAKGAVYVFNLVGGTWTQTQKITESGAADLLGFSIACDGTTLCIGQIGTNSVYVYTLVGSTWTLQQTLTGSDSIAGDSFGSAVSVATAFGLLAVGAYQASGVDATGKAYLFKLNNLGSWVQSQEFTPPDATSGPNFYGLSIQVGAFLQPSQEAYGWLVVGAPGWQSPGSGYGEGQVYFYFSEAPDPISKIIQAQIAFQGVARKPGPPPQIAPVCDFMPKTYSYVGTAILDAIGPANTPTASVIVTVNDYDFELDEIVLTYSSAVNPLPRVCAMTQLFDSVKNQVSNIPMLDVYQNGAPGSPYQNGALVPPLVYPNQTQIRIDFYSMLEQIYLPVTVTVEFKGRQRYPCVQC